MYKELFSILLAMTLLVPLRDAFAQADTQAKIVHLPVTNATAGQAIRLEIKIEGTTARAQEARIYYRQQDEEGYDYVEMVEEVERWVGRIPARDVVVPRVEYFISVVMDAETILTYPEFNPYYDPLQVVVTEPVIREGERPPIAGGEIGMLVLSPQQGELLAADDFFVAVSILGEPEEVDSSSIAVFLDGINITSAAEISANLISYSPDRIEDGSHSVRVTAKDAEGRSITPAEVTFTIRGRGEGKITSEFSGRVYTDVRYENVSDIEEDTYVGGGRIDGRYGKLRYQAHVFLTSREKSDMQPRNRYTLRLDLPWVGIRLGDTNPRFNDLILWGKRVRGVHGYVRTRYFNFDLVYGQTQRAVEGTADSLGVSRSGTFKQTLFGIRPSFGIPRRFLLGFNFIKAKDDTSSIEHGTSPRDNIVLGPDLLVTADRHRVEFRAAAAVSMTTQDTYLGTYSKAVFDTVYNEKLPFDPEKVRDLIIYNDSTTPLDPRDWTSLAYNMSLKLNYFGNLFRLGYKSIGSEYYSLGNNFVRRDIRGWYASDRARLLKNQLYLTLGIESYDDNFSQDDGNPKLDMTTYNVAVSYVPGPQYPRVNVSYRSRLRDNGVDSLYISTTDSFAIGEANTTKDYSFQISHDVNFLDLRHTISLNWISSDRVDKLESSKTAGTVSTDLSTDMRMVSLRTKFNSPLTTVANYAWSQNKALGGKSSFKYNMIDLLGEYQLLSGSLILSANLRRISAKGAVGTDGTIEYDKNSFQVGARYRPTTSTYVLVDATYISFIDRGIEADGTSKLSYDDVLVRARLEKYF